MKRKQRKTNYPLAIILNTASTVMPVLSFMYLGIADVPISKNTVGLVICAVSLIQWLVLKIPLKLMLEKAIEDNEYDEFGRNKSKHLLGLTRKEREQIDYQKTAQMEALISTTALKNIIRRGSADPEGDLSSLVGLADVKKKVLEMAARMKFEKEMNKTDKSQKKQQLSAVQQYGMNGRHFCFYGSAGTGKTTIARIIAGFLYKYGYIKENKCVEVDGNFLKAGEMTDTKTKLIIEQAYGGVLFIDEAYTIIDGNTNYGKAAIATLIKEMEDNRDKFTVILAGYKNDMKRLLDSNEGFKSRIKEYLEFPNYSVSEMQEIFVSMAKSHNLTVSNEALERFAVRCVNEMRLPSFGNGRTARNILDEVIDKHAFNYGTGHLSRTETIPVESNNEIEPNIQEAEQKFKEITYSNEECKFVICGCDVDTNANCKVL